MKTVRIIPRTDGSAQGPGWQQALADAVREPFDLLQRLGLETAINASDVATQAFPLRVPLEYIARMRRGDPYDPLLRQVLPLSEEFKPQPGFTADPLQEQAAMPVPGLLQKYHGRVLLTITGACAIHCRYCFRRHYPYNEANPTRQDWQEVFGYLEEHPEVTELILSGGDPLSLPDSRLADLARRCESIPHLKTLRIHSRLPVVIPQRIDDALIEWINACKLNVVLVVHVNHARELDETTRHAFSKIRNADVTLLNQSVLLRGVNDNADALCELSRELLENGILPYYLHQLDRVSGAAHFEVSDSRARALLDEVHARLPGYLVPRLVRENPEEAGKTLI